MRKIIVACDAGMGSSAMGAGVGLKNISVTNSAINNLPDNVDLVITHPPHRRQRFSRSTRGSADHKEQAIRFAGEQFVKGGYVQPEYVQAMLDHEKLTSTLPG